MGYLKESILTRDAKAIDGWFFSTKTGLYGTNYRMRALITAIGFVQSTILPGSRTLPNALNCIRTVIA
jgi:hypothetical protein